MAGLTMFLRERPPCHVESPLQFFWRLETLKYLRLSIGPHRSRSTVFSEYIQATGPAESAEEDKRLMLESVDLIRALLGGAEMQIFPPKVIADHPRYGMAAVAHE
jgi:hypothetical protein